MTALVPPSLDCYDAWRACVEEFGDAHMDGSGHHGPTATDHDAFTAYVEDRLLQADRAHPVAEGRVHCSFRWIVEEGADAEVIGFLAVRHELNAFLLEQGGHVGYAVRPSRRREGHATRALALALPQCRALGIERVLVTCDEDNVASARTIEHVMAETGGAYEDTRHGKRRYWLTTP